MVKLMTALTFLPKKAQASKKFESSPPNDARVVPDYRAARVSVLPVDYPNPAYLPSGYRFSYATRRVQAGFRSKDEVLLLYGDPMLKTAYPFPFHVCMTKHPENAFAGTELATSADVLLTIRGLSIVGQYYDGMWLPTDSGTIRTPNGQWLTWDRSNGHMLVARINGITVGVRGYRLAGVSKSELLRVVESIR